MANTKKAKGRGKKDWPKSAVEELVLLADVERHGRDSERPVMDDICDEYRSRFPKWLACSDAQAAFLPYDPNVIVGVSAGLPERSSERAAAALDVVAVNQRLLRYISYCSKRGQ